MHEISLAFTRLPPLRSNRGPARLVSLKIGARRDFLVSVLARQPDFDIVGFRRACARVSGAKHDRTIRQAEPLKYIFGIASESFEFVVARFRRSELHQLYFLKLVLPDNAAHVTAVRACFTAETRRI